MQAYKPKEGDGKTAIPQKGFDTCLVLPDDVCVMAKGDGRDMSEYVVRVLWKEGGLERSYVEGKLVGVKRI